jgi:hypothetical protein
MFTITAIEARASQRRQLNHYQGIWSAAIYEAISRRCAKAWLEFSGDVNAPVEVHTLNAAVPRGGTFENWYRELAD